MRGHGVILPVAEKSVTCKMCDKCNNRQKNDIKPHKTLKKVLTPNLPYYRVSRNRMTKRAGNMSISFSTLVTYINNNASETLLKDLAELDTTGYVMSIPEGWFGVWDTTTGRLLGVNEYQEVKVKLGLEGQTTLLGYIVAKVAPKNKAALREWLYYLNRAELTALAVLLNSKCIDLKHMDKGVSFEQVLVTALGVKPTTKEKHLDYLANKAINPKLVNTVGIQGMSQKTKQAMANKYITTVKAFEEETDKLANMLNMFEV